MGLGKVWGRVCVDVGSVAGVCGGGGCDALRWIVRLRKEGKNVRGEDGQFVQPQRKMSDDMHRERSAR